MLGLLTNKAGLDLPRCIDGELADFNCACCGA